MEKLNKLIVLIALLFGFVGLVFGFRGIILSIHSVPSLDTFSILNQISNEGPSLFLGWTPYEDHRPVIPVILLQASLLLTEIIPWGTYFPQVFTMLAVFLLFASIFYLNLRDDNASNLEIHVFFLLLVFSLTHPFQSDSLLTHFRTWVGLSLLLSTVSCFSFYQAFYTTHQKGRRIFFILSLFGAILASLTGASGLLTWGALLLLALSLRVGHKYILVIIASAVVSVFIIRPRSGIGFFDEGGLIWLLHPFDYLVELSYFFGSVLGRGLFVQPVASYSVDVSVVIGVVFLVTSLFLIYQWLTNAQKVNFSSVGMFAIICFGMGWGGIYILKHGVVPPNPRNWISAGSYGMVIFPMLVCVIFQVYRKLRPTRFKPLVFLLVIAVYVVILPSHIVTWEYEKNRKFGWELGLSRLITELVLQPDKLSTNLTFYEPATVTRATIKMLSRYNFPPFSDRRIREVVSNEHQIFQTGLIENCTPNVSTKTLVTDFGKEILLSTSQVLADMIPMVMDELGTLVGYGVIRQKL